MLIPVRTATSTTAPTSGVGSRFSKTCASLRITAISATTRFSIWPARSRSSSLSCSSSRRARPWTWCSSTYTAAGWFELPFNREDDTTGGLIANGQITLRHECGPNAKKTKIAGRESYWLRMRLATPLLRAGIEPLITINDLRVRAEFGKTGLKLDAAASDGQSLDVSRDFHPFGRLPARGSTFALACKEAFSRPGAVVKVNFTLSTNGGVPTSETLDLEWEYTTESGWEPITLINNSPTVTFDKSPESVLFRAPVDWAEMDVGGAKQRWLRARIKGGSYGVPLRFKELTADQPKFEGGTIKPPVIESARVSFSYQTDPEAVDHCITYNDFRYEDRTAAAQWPDQSFVPFVPVEDVSPAVHFGFDRALPQGLVSLLLDVPDAPSGSISASPYLWEFLAADGWRELAVLDETVGFTPSRHDPVHWSARRRGARRPGRPALLLAARAGQARRAAHGRRVQWTLDQCRVGRGTPACRARARGARRRQSRAELYGAPLACPRR